jgi:hypothetical protein
LKSKRLKNQAFRFTYRLKCDKFSINLVKTTKFELAVCFCARSLLSSMAALVAQQQQHQQQRDMQHAYSNMTVTELLAADLSFTQVSADTAQLLLRQRDHDVQSARDRFQSSLEQLAPVQVQTALLENLARAEPLHPQPEFDDTLDEADAAEIAAVVVECNQLISSLRVKLAQLGEGTEALAAEGAAAREQLALLSATVKELSPDAQAALVEAPIGTVLQSTAADAEAAAIIAANEQQMDELEAINAALEAALVTAQAQVGPLEAEIAALADEAMHAACADLDEMTVEEDGQELGDVADAELEEEAVAEEARAARHRDMAAWYSHTAAALEALSGFRMSVANYSSSEAAAAAAAASAGSSPASATAAATGLEVTLHFDCSAAVAARLHPASGALVALKMVEPSEPPAGVDLARVLELAAAEPVGGGASPAAGLRTAARELRQSFAGAALRLQHVQQLREVYLVSTRPQLSEVSISANTALFV